MPELRKDIEVGMDRPNSVEISVNAKGDISYKVKCYAEDIHIATTEAQGVKIRMDAWIKDQEAVAATN